MRPETAAGAPEARGRDCHCPGDGSQPHAVETLDADTQRCPADPNWEPGKGSIYPFPSARSTCRVPGKRCWPASRCKPPSTSTTTSQAALILKATAQRKRRGPWVAGTRRRNVAQGHRAEPGWYTELQEGVAPSARGSSPTATLPGAARALHPNEWGLSPSANLLSLCLLLLLGTRTL
ncbi:protein ripply3 isoform X2 [Lepus europaeus]|uniref:protein ripply3 isoform X2 n=1 Tax=Lepus europaeus TaxID=9983 RepID=UPI002B46F72D|nr:protein ripply3 isoform X2 [Lepus europaeus]